MQPTQRLDRFLPTRFKRGTLVRQFSKPCIRCNTMLHASEMHGIARLIDDHLALGAVAHCPHCHARFPVSCVIDADKRVRRVMLPGWAFRFYLRLIPRQSGERVAHDDALSQLARESRHEAMGHPTYPRAPEVIGQYQGRAIAAHIVVDGHAVPFDRVAQGGSLATGEYLIDELFVYKAS